MHSGAKFFGVCLASSAVLVAVAIASRSAITAMGPNPATMSQLDWLGHALFLWGSIMCGHLCLLYHLHRHSAASGALGCGLISAALLYYLALESPGAAGAPAQFPFAVSAFGLMSSMIVACLVLLFRTRKGLARGVQLAVAASMSVLAAYGISRIPQTLLADFVSSRQLLPVALIVALGSGALILFVLGRRALWHLWQAGLLYLFCTSGLLFLSLYEGPWHIAPAVLPYLGALALTLFPLAALFDAWQLIGLQPAASASESQEAVVDSLTGIFNRRALEQTGPRIISTALRSNQAVTILMMDLDHFKRINDLYGHSAGDTVLKAFVDIIGAQVRATDFVARYGGEEFVAILPGAPLAPAMRLADRIRQESELAEVQCDGQKIRITASIGAASVFPGDTQSFRQILDRADKNLLRAKRNGRNCVLADPLPNEETA